MDMCNCLKMPTSRIRKILASIFVFVTLCAGAMAETYYWTGTDTTSPTHWSVANNWRTDTDNPATTVPGASDIVYIRSNTTIDIGSSDVTIDGLSLGNNGLSENFTVTITGDGTLNVTGTHVFTDHGAADQGIVTFRPTNTVDTSKVSTLILNCNVISPSLAIHSGGRVTIGTGKTAEITSLNMMANNANTPTNLTVQGTLISDSITAANYNNQIIIVNEDAILSTQTISGSDGFITNNGLVITESSVDDLINNSSTGTETTADSDSFIWTGAVNSDWSSTENWLGGSIPANNDKISIPAVEHNPVIKSEDEVSFDISKINIEENANITVQGTLNISGNFSIDNKINISSEGILKVTGELSTTSSYSATSLSLECATLNVSANLECKSINITSTSSLNNTSGETSLVARGNDGIKFGNTVTVNSTGIQFILGGNVNSTGAVNINIASGRLNHTEVSNHKNWNTNLTTVLQNDGCTFGMAETTAYNTKIEATSGTVYFTGNGTIASIEDSGAGCDIHFGNANSAQDDNITFSSDIEFNTTGKIVFDESCSKLLGSVTLSDIKTIENKSSKLTDILGVNFSLANNAKINGASATDNALKFYDLTFTGSAEVNVDIENNGSLSAAGAITFNENYTNKGTAAFDEASRIAGDFVNSASSSATFSAGLSLAGNFTDSGTAFSGDITLNGSGPQTFKGGTATPGYDVILDKSSGNVEFTDALTLNSLDAATNSYTGNITFNGTGTQTLTPQSGIYEKITVDKTSGTLAVNNDLQAKTLTLTSGSLSFGGNLTLWDGTNYSDADFSTTDNINFTGGSSASPRLFKAKSITTAGSIICSDGASSSTKNSFLKLQATDGNISIGNNIGGTSNYYNTVVLDAGAKDITITGKIYTSDISVTCNSIEFNNSSFSGNVGITAANTLVIKNGFEASTLTIDPSAQTIKMGGTIKLTDASQDFIINYPLLLSANTTFQIAGNIVIKNSDTKAGSINSENNTARSLSLQTTETGKTIQIQNGTYEGAGLGTTKQLSAITINSSLELTADTTFKTSGNNGTTFSGTGTLGGTGGTLTTTGNFRNNGTWTINRPVIVTGNLSNLAGKSITFNKNVSVTGNVTDSGTWNSEDGKKLIFNGTGNGTQTFTPVSATTYKLVEVNKSDGFFSTASDKNLNVANFTLTACPATTFNGVSTFTTFNSDAAEGTITFANDTTIKSDTEFETAGTVTFSNGKTFAFDDGTEKHTVKHTAGTTYLTGSITSQKATFGTTVLLAATTIYGESQFDGTIDGTFDLTTNGLANFYDSVGNATALSSLLTKSAKINCTSIKTTGAQTYDGTVSLLKNGSITLFAKNGEIYQTVTFKGNVDCSGATGTQNLIIDAKTNINGSSITTTGTQKYKSEVTIANTISAIALEGSRVSFDDKIIGNTGNKGLALTAGTTTFGDQSADTVTDLASLDVNGNAVVNTNTITTTSNQTYRGTTQFNSVATITSGGAQSYTDTITLNANVTLKTGITSSISFGADISGSDKTLTVNSLKLISSIEEGDTPANISLDTLAISGNTQISSTNAAGINLDVSSITGADKTLTFDGNTTLIKLKDGINIEPAVVNNKSINCLGTATFYNTVNNAGNLTCTGTASFVKTVTNTGAIICKSTATFKDNFTNTNGSISGDTTGKAPLTFEKNYSGTGTSFLTASNGQTIFYGNVDLSATIFSHSSGNVILKAPSGSESIFAELKTGTGKEFNNLNLECKVTLSAAGTNVISSLTINDSVKILCNNTITDFIADTTVNGTAGLGGKTITFGAGTEQTVEGTLILKGSDNSDDNRLQLCSYTPGTQWKIKCTGQNNHNIQYVDVKDSHNESETGSPTATSYNLFALDSIDKGHNTKWNFPGMKYVWEGSADTNWNNAANWKYTSIPGKGADIEIPAGCSKYPVLLTALDLNDTYNSNDYKGKITIKPKETGNTEGKLDLADYNLTLGEISNYGLVRLIGASGQTISGKMINQNASTVEYYDTGATSTNFVWDGDGVENGNQTNGKQYANLILNQNTSGSDILEISENLDINYPASLSGDVTVGGNLTIAEATTLYGAVNITGTTTISAGTGNIVSLDTASNKFIGHVIIGNSASTPQVNAGVVTLNGTGTSSSAIYLKNNILADSLTLNSNVQGGDLTITAPLTINTAAITTTGNQTYAGTVSLLKDGDITFTAKNGTIYQNLTFNGDVNCIGATGTPNLIIDARANIYCSSITTTGYQTYNNEVFLQNATNLSSTAGITFRENVKGTSLTVTAPLTVNCSSIKTTGTQTYNGTVILENTLSLKSDTDSITFVQPITGNKALSVESSGGTTFAANVGSQETPLSSLTVIGPLTISCANLYTSGQQTFYGDVIVSEDVTFNTNDTINGNINFDSKVDSKTSESHSITLNIPTQRSVVFTNKVGETTAPSVIINQAGNVSFDEPVTLNSLTDTASAGNIIFKSGATISTATQLLSTGYIRLTGTLIAPSLKMNNLIADGSAVINTTGAGGTQTYHGTINGETEHTDILTLSSDSDITFDSGIGQTTALKTLAITGPAKFSSNISVTADTVTFNTSLGSTSSEVRKLTIKDCNTLTNPTAATTVSNIDFIFTGDAGRLTSFNPGASEYLNITTDTIELNLGSNTFNQNSNSDFKITSGSVKAGIGGLTAGNLIVSGGDFIQTGDATDQVNDITLSGGSIIWDSSAQGGSLTINGVMTEADDLQINYNKKSVTFTHDNTISGIFWNLTIDSGRTITNGGRIRVRKNFTIDGNYVHNNKPIIFGLDLTAPETDSTENGEITDKASSNIGKAYINKEASLKQTAATNLIFKDLEITSGTFENPGTITSKTEILTNTAAATISNAGTLNITKTFTDNGTYTGAGLLKFTGTSAQTFAPGTSTYSNIENTLADPLTVSRALKATNFEIKSGKSTTFTGTIQVTNLSLTSAVSTAFEKTSQITNLTISNASETTFEQTVTITNFDDTNHNGNISFKNDANISTATEIQTPGLVTLTGTLTLPSLIMNNLVIDGSAIITTNGSQTYNGTIEDSAAGTHTLTLNSGTSQITFAADIGQTQAPKILTVNSPAAINCAAVTTTDEQNYNAGITSTGTITLKSSAINLDCSEGTPNASVTTVGSQTYDGQVNILSDTSLASDTGYIHLKSPLRGEHKFTIAKTNDASFDDTVNITDFEIAQANESTFADTVTAETFSITQAASTTFVKTVQISTFSDTDAAGDITFTKGGCISNADGTNFLTRGTVTLVNSTDSTMTFGSAAPYANITHTEGNTNISGTLNTANITLAQTNGGSITIANSGLFKTINGESLTYTDSFTQNGKGNSVIGGSFSGNGDARFETNLQLYGSSPAAFGSPDKKITVNKNLIITRDNTLTINGELEITNNLVFYNGDITANANISTNEDIILLGSDYKIKDDSTGIEDEFAYTTPRHSNWSQPNYKELLLPDGNALPASTAYSARLAVAANKKIASAKNFYANGTSLSTAESNGQWLLSLPDITNPSKGFAEAYHSVVSGCKVICNDETEDGTKARLVALKCTDSSDGTSTPNTNVEFEDFQITKAYTVRDNVVRVEFNQPVRYHATTIASLKYHDNSDAIASTTNFTGFYEDPDCQNELTSDITQHYTDEADGRTYYYFFIKAEPQDSASTGAWNTDATGKTSGAADGKSSDRHGIHHTALPCLDFPRALSGNGTTANLSFIITDIWGKRLNNYSRRVPKGTTAEAAYGSTYSSDANYEVADNTGPVMWTVRTGQEMHTAYSAAAGEAGQHSYDAHNFLEFRYSEPVEFTPLDPAVTENIQVTDTFGAIKEDDIRQEASSLTFAGIAKLTASSDSSLQLYTGKNGSPDKYVNALYRTDEYSLRLSIAGWTDGTVSDYSGNTYKNWTGYIEHASQFTRATAAPVTTATTPNDLIKDLAGNSQIEYAVNKIEPTVYSDSTSENPSALLPATPDLYSSWDISKPVFTPLRFSAETKWKDVENAETSEAIGNTNGSGSTLDRIDFHFFDNTPTYGSSDPAEWFTESGWCVPGSEGTKDYLYASYTYAADIIGGARQFDPISESDTVNYRRTSGGIRLSTKLGAANGFKYSTDTYETNPATPFATGIENIHSTVISQLFTGSSEPQHAANDPDGLYLGIGITDTALPVETSFAFKYDDSKAYLTDLAGNRLRSSKTLKTIDRTPPSFDIILSPVDQNQVYVVFVKKIVTDSSKIDYRDPDTGLEYNVADELSTANFLEMLPSCFKIISINSDGSFTPSTDIQIDTAVPARIVDRYSDNHFTCVCLTLNKEITTENIKNLYIQLSHHPDYPETSPDPWTSNSNAHVTFIQDELGNYMQMYSAHALSDFAIGLVNPLYAYSSDITENDEPVMSGLYNEGSWAVHDWNAEQKNYGTLPAAHSAAIVTQQVDGTEDGSELPENIRIYLSNSPDKGSVSSQFNKDFGTSLRVWLPDLTDGIFRALSAKNNSNWSFLDGEPLEEGNFNNLIFNIPLEMINTWKSGDQISFMFGITESDGSPVKIYNSPYYDTELKRYDFALSSAVPLYALRMHDVTDIGSLDLWSFRLKGITTQRGGVTILNNVINATNGEKTVLKVDVPTEGRINVMVMTLDGNIITYLHRGNAKAGENYFTWDGKNRNGNLVARGMYFIRVTGADFDETRKVMVVK